MANEKYIDKIKKDGEEYLIYASNSGTKLYKHSIRITIWDGSDEESAQPVDIDLIIADGNSLVGKDIPNDYLSGILTYDYSYSPLMYADELYFIFYFVDQREIRHMYVKNKVLTDTVTEL